jgi:hypothetical protein
MKKIISLIAVIAFLAQGSPLLALDSNIPVGQPNGKFLIPLATNGIDDSMRAWSMPSICRAQLSTVAVVCEGAASGFITDIEVDSGAAGGWAVALDSQVSGGATAAAPGANLIASQQTCPAASTAGAACGERKWNEDGRPFFNGLVIVASSVDTYVTVTYRKLRAAPPSIAPH